MLDPADRVEIHELMADYGHLVDDRDFGRVGEIFTDDVVYDMTDFGLGSVTGVDAVVEMWRGPDAAHPLAHHATNVVIRQDDSGMVQVRSKGIGVGHGGRVGSVDYHDLVVKTDQGWRIAERSGTLRRADNG